MFLFPFDPTQLPASLGQLLAWAAAASGVIASWIFTNVPFFKDVPDWAKQVFSVVLGIVFTSLLTWFQSMASPDTVGKLNALYLMIVQILITLAGVVGYHFGYRGIVKPAQVWVAHKLHTPSGSQG